MNLAAPTSSIRTRLVLGAALVLLAFLAATGTALQTAHANSVRAAHFARLQSTVYLLLAGAELDTAGALVMPAELAEPRLSLPGSGLYASVQNLARGTAWQSGSALGLNLPFEREAGEVGVWRYGTRQGLQPQVGSQGSAASSQDAYLAAAYTVRWAQREAPVLLVLSVLESRQAFDRELAAFSATLWRWLGGAALLLLLSQTLLLTWALAPLRRVAQEIARVENGEQAEVEGRYPAEIATLTGNLNTLIRQERVRQTRYKEALSYLAHSLKTPLAVLRTALVDPSRSPELPGAVAEQVDRMDAIVQHQLARAAARGGARFVPPLVLAPVLQRVRDSLLKVYADKGLGFSLNCPVELAARLDEGDAFEMLGNVLDNAAKWAQSRVAVDVWRNSSGLHIQVDDDGRGFSDPQAALQLHVRGDESVPGHGVGLAVVNELVASHDGELSLSRSPWGGARVAIRLPQA